MFLAYLSNMLSTYYCIEVVRNMVIWTGNGFTIREHPVCWKLLVYWILDWWVNLIIIYHLFSQMECFYCHAHFAGTTLIPYIFSPSQLFIDIFTSCSDCKISLIQSYAQNLGQLTPSRDQVICILCKASLACLDWEKRVQRQARWTNSSILNRLTRGCKIKNLIIVYYYVCLFL